MKSMIVLVGLLALSAASPQYWHGGYAGHAPTPVQDTPEVAAAKAEHFAAVARAGGSAVPYAGAAYSSHGAPAPVLDTPEVAAAKAQHFAAVAAAGGSPAPYAGQWNAAPYAGYYAAPSAYASNGAPLPVQDTPEVAAEKAKHFAAVAAAGGSPAPYWNAAPYAAPYAYGHGGLPSDTPEVAAAKAAHLAAHAAASSGHSGHWRRRRDAYGYGGFSYSTVSVAPLPYAAYSAPLAYTPASTTPLLSAPVPYAAHAYPYAAHAYPYAAHAYPYAMGAPLDTPEVAAAKVAHAAAHVEARARLAHAVHY